MDYITLIIPALLFITVMVCVVKQLIRIAGPQKWFGYNLRIKRDVIERFQLQPVHILDSQVWYEGGRHTGFRYWICFDRITNHNGEIQFSSRTKMWFFAGYQANDPKALVKDLTDQLALPTFGHFLYRAVKDSPILRNERVMVAAPEVLREKFHIPDAIQPSGNYLVVMQLDGRLILSQTFPTLIQEASSTSGLSDDQRKQSIRSNRIRVAVMVLGFVGSVVLYAAYQATISKCNAWQSCVQRSGLDMEITITQKSVTVRVPVLQYAGATTKSQVCPRAQFDWGDGNIESAGACNNVSYGQKSRYEFIVSEGHTYKSGGTYKVVFDVLNDRDQVIATDTRSITIP